MIILLIHFAENIDNIFKFPKFLDPGPSLDLWGIGKFGPIPSFILDTGPLSSYAELENRTPFRIPLLDPGPLIALWGIWKIWPITKNNESCKSKWSQIGDHCRKLCGQSRLSLAWNSIAVKKCSCREKF